MDELSQELNHENGSSGKLLGPQERLDCRLLSTGQPPYSRRALSLLAIDAGATQSAAAQQSGQTVGQVRYWLGKFRKGRMAIFPEELLPQAEPEPVEEKTKDSKADLGLEKKAKAKKKGKKDNAPQKAPKKTKKQKKQKKSKSGKKQQGKKKPSGKKNGKKKKVKNDGHQSTAGNRSAG